MYYHRYTKIWVPKQPDVFNHACNSVSISKEIDVDERLNRLSKSPGGIDCCKLVRRVYATEERVTVRIITFVKFLTEIAKEKLCTKENNSNFVSKK